MKRIIKSQTWEYSPITLSDAEFSQTAGRLHGHPGILRLTGALH
jgi:hypothetical protein